MRGNGASIETGAVLSSTVGEGLCSKEIPSGDAGNCGKLGLKLKMDVEILCISGLAWMLFLNMDVRNLDVFDFCFQKKGPSGAGAGFSSE